MIKEQKINKICRQIKIHIHIALRKEKYHKGNEKLSARVNSRLDAIKERIDEMKDKTEEILQNTGWMSNL